MLKCQRERSSPSRGSSTCPQSRRTGPNGNMSRSPTPAPWRSPALPAPPFQPSLDSVEAEPRGPRAVAQLEAAPLENARGEPVEGRPGGGTPRPVEAAPAFGNEWAPLGGQRALRVDAGSRIGPWGPSGKGRLPARDGSPGHAAKCLRFFNVAVRSLQGVTVIPYPHEIPWWRFAAHREDST
jgi:hypothetical protein